MNRLYLNVPYREKDAAKALGARFCGERKLWYAPSGLDAPAFSKWLPAGTGVDVVVVPATALEPARSDAGAVQVAARGISLSRLLNGVTQAVAAAYALGVWTVVEVLRVSSQKGHVYLEVSERDGNGRVLAKASAVIWANTAARILPEFETATGAILADGLKLLVRARPDFKAQYGFMLEVDAIDPAYTLGDLEARKKEIRDRLRRDGVFDLNRLLGAPWDFRTVLVVAPQGAAGLGDFQKESDRLARFGLCRFIYLYSRFQGEGAAGEIAATLRGFLAGPDNIAPLDAIVIIRGGGAVNDLAWLNDYDLARLVCEQSVPVLVGIGHERDKTLLDEVAHQSFDTPSKTIAGIEQAIVRRAGLARAAAEAVFALAAAQLREADRHIERLHQQSALDARDHIARARQGIDQDMGAIRLDTARLVGEGSRSSLALFHQIRHDAVGQVAHVREHVPNLFGDIRTRALGLVGDARGRTTVSFNTVVDRTTARLQRARAQADAGLSLIAERAQGSLALARTRTQGLMREVTGQGPDKTLKRGFALVRSVDGRPLTRAEHVGSTQVLEIEFSNGVVQARAGENQPTEKQ